jgi:hypothetical protein
LRSQNHININVGGISESVSTTLTGWSWDVSTSSKTSDSGKVSSEEQSVDSQQL